MLGLDLGASRSWSAAALWWRNGRAEVYASIPGIPDIDVQERSLGFGRGVLRSMVAQGTVAVAEGKRVADIDVLLDRLPAVDVQGVVADRFLAGAIISRIWHASDTVFRFNRTGAGSLAAWVWGELNVRSNGEFRPGDPTDNPLGEGHAKSIFLAFGPDDGLVEVEILLLSLIASSGTGWMNLELSAEQNALLDTLGGDYEVNFVIGDTAGEPVPPATLDTSGAVAAGAPVVEASVEVVPAAVRETVATVTAGAPVVSGDVEVVPAGDADTGGTAEAGAPVVTGRVEVVRVQAPSDAERRRGGRGSQR